MSNTQMSVILTPLYVYELVCMHIFTLCICFCAHVCTHLFMYSYLCVQILMFIWICLRVFVGLHVYELLIFVYTVRNHKSIKNFQRNICHHPGLFFWVHLAGWKKKIIILRWKNSINHYMFNFWVLCSTSLCVFTFSAMCTLPFWI